MGAGDGGGNGMGSCCAKTILIITNVFFFLIGLAFFAVGLAVKFAGNYLQPYVDQATSGIPQAAAAASIADPNTSSDSATITINIDEFLGDLYVVFICIGLFIMIVGVLGMCGACCTSKCMLIAYAVIIFLLILVELACVIIICTGVMNSHIKEQFQTIIKTKYAGTDKYDRESLLLNVIMLQFKCCGIDNYEDFNTSTSWQRTRTFNHTASDGTTVSVQRTLVTPLACCKMDADFPDGKPIDNNCIFTPDSTNSHFDKGCFTEVASFIISNYQWPLIGAVVGVFVFELILAVLAIVISKASDSKSSVEAF